MSDSTSFNPRLAIGFDDSADIFFVGNSLIRGIHEEHIQKYKKVIDKLPKDKLNDLGIVPTKVVTDENLIDFFKYKLLLEHEKITFISYPHEWPFEMLKDSAIFHVDMHEKLSNLGLTFKDFHPYNILFDGIKPVFVDFTSIIPIESLDEEDYLKQENSNLNHFLRMSNYNILTWEIYRRMCIPFFLLPLYLMHLGKYSEARTLLSEHALNTLKPEVRTSDVFRPLSLLLLKYHVFSLAKRLSLLSRSAFEESFWRLLRIEVNGLKIKKTKGDYLDYYAGKNEDFDFKDSSLWGKKNKSVYKVMELFSPSTFLDIGCNTGWYSVLAAKNGAKVVAIDVEESCVNRLYFYAKSHNLPILPLVSSFQQLQKCVYPGEYKKYDFPFLLDTSVKNIPLLLAGTERFRCEMVIALALVHHLVLGQGIQLFDVAKVLSRLTQKVLVLEFVDLRDELIENNKSFFPQYSNFANKPSLYSFEVCISSLEQFFSNIEILPSSDDSRHLIVCSR